MTAPAQPGSAGRAERRARVRGLLLLAPALVTLATLTLYPTIWVGWLSLQRRMPIFGVSRFEGMGNYAFLATDPRFWKATQVTLLFPVASVVLELIGGVLAAVALRSLHAGSVPPCIEQRQRQSETERPDACAR